MALISFGICGRRRRNSARIVNDVAQRGLLKSAALVATFYSAVSLIILTPINVIASPVDFINTRSLLSTTWRNIKIGSNWTWMHVFVCLILTTLHLIYVAKETSAHLNQRRDHLQKLLFSEQMVSPSSRTIFIPNLPPNWRNEHTLASVFDVFGDGVEAAFITRRIPKSLKKDLDTRRKAIHGLETILNRQSRQLQLKETVLPLRNYQLEVDFFESNPRDALFLEKVDVHKDLPKVPEVAVIDAKLFLAPLAHEHVILNEPGIPTVVVQGADDEAAAVAIPPLSAESQGCDDNVDCQFEARTCYMIQEEDEEEENGRRSEESHHTARNSVSSTSSRSTSASSETAQIDSRSADISNFCQGLLALHDDICNQQKRLLAAHINPEVVRSRENTLTSEDTMVECDDSRSHWVGQGGFVMFRSPRTALWIAEKMNSIDSATKRKAGLTIGQVEWNCKVTDMCWDDLDLSQLQANKLRWIWWCIYVLTFCIGGACSVLITMLVEIPLPANKSPGLQALIQGFFSNIIPALLLQLLFAMSGQVFARIAKAVPTSTLSSDERRAQVMTVCWQISTLLITMPIACMIRLQNERQSNWSTLFIASFIVMSAINLLPIWRGKSDPQGRATDSCYLVTILVAAMSHACISPVTTIPTVIVFAVVAFAKKGQNTIPTTIKSQLYMQSCVGCVLGSLYLCASFMLQQEWAKAGVLLVCATSTLAVMVILWYRLSIPLRRLLDMKDCEVDVLNWRQLLNGQARTEPPKSNSNTNSSAYCTIHSCCEGPQPKHNLERWYYDPRLTEDMQAVNLVSINDVALLQRCGIPAALVSRI